MIILRNKDSGAQLGTISAADFQFLSDNLVRESPEDRDYFIDEDTIEVLAEAGASPELLELLRGAIAGTGEAEIEWSRT